MKNHKLAYYDPFELKIHTDIYGFIGQPRGEGIESGDCIRWQSDLCYLIGKRFQIEFFEKGFGGYVRHFNATLTDNGFGAYYKNPWAGCISRDQSIGIIAYNIKFKRYWAHIKFMLHHACWLFLFSYNNIKNGVSPTNIKNGVISPDMLTPWYNPFKWKWKFPDITFMDVWAMELRGFGWFSWLLWPILNLLDLWMFLSTIWYNSKESSDPISFAMKLIVTREHIPTIVSYINFKIVNKRKLKNEIHNYWCGWRDQCAMTELYTKKIDDLS